MFPISAPGPRSLRLLVVAGLATALLAVIAGCGGGGTSGTGSSSSDGGDDDATRSKLLDAADALADQPTVEVLVLINVQLEEEDGEETESSACFTLGVDRSKATDDGEEVALRTYPSGCDGSDPASEVVVIGRDLWATQFGGKWAQGRVDPELVEELTDEDDKYDALLEAASDFRPGPEPRSYEFTAPASAFSQTEDAGDVDVDFVITLDENDVLQSLVADFEVEEAKAVIEEKYETEHIAPIAAPAEKDVIGPVRPIDSEEALESLLTPSFGEGLDSSSTP